METATTGNQGGLEANMNTATPQTAAPTANNTTPPAAPTAGQPAMNPQEEIGFHKGALNTLVAERNELVKMVGNVDAIMQAHLTRLKELGVDITPNNDQTTQQSGEQPPQQ